MNAGFWIFEVLLMGECDGSGQPLTQAGRWVVPVTKGGSESVTVIYC